MFTNVIFKLLYTIFEFDTQFIQIHIINTEYHYLPNKMYEIKGNNTCLLEMLIYWSY